MSPNTQPISERARKMKELEFLAHLLDEAIEIPGTGIRIGLDSIIGLVPGVGDLISAAVSGYIVREASRLGVSRFTLGRMMGNIALDAAVGAIPILGDIFDVGFKANRKNLALLRKHVGREIIDITARPVPPERASANR